MAAALALFQVLLAMAAAELQRQRTFEQLASLVPGFVRELVGTALVSMMSFSGIMALGYYHVAIVAVLVGLVVAVATEPAAEVETGFADLVLAQAVSREAVMTRSVVLLVICPAIVIAAMTAGTFAGLWLAAPAAASRPPARLVWTLAVEPVVGPRVLGRRVARRRRLVAPARGGGGHRRRGGGRAHARRLPLARVEADPRDRAALAVPLLQPARPRDGEAAAARRHRHPAGTAACAVALAFVLFRRRDI